MEEVNISTDNNISTDSSIDISLEQELMADLTDELSVSDELFNEKLLLSKLKNAIREVKRARRYPATYTDEMIYDDLHDYYSNIRNIALYDYNTTGVEGQTSSNENGTSRSYIDRNKLFGGIIPLAQL